MVLLPSSTRAVFLDAVLRDTHIVHGFASCHLLYNQQHRTPGNGVLGAEKEQGCGPSGSSRGLG